jgi:hypothetical protein
MLSKILSRQIYLGDYGWHVGRFHFSFADYEDPENLRFGNLLTFNDFTLQPGSGFEAHPHEEIEIISYCIQGELVHEDSMGNKETLTRGEVQYTCAGSGISHSERNGSQHEPLRFVQIWIRPNAPGLPPSYRSGHFRRSDRLNKLLQISSGHSIKNGIRINQDTNIYVSEMNKGRQLKIRLLPDRQIYLACLEGTMHLNTASLEAGDAIKVWNESVLSLIALEDCHLVTVEMPIIQ